MKNKAIIRRQILARLKTFDKSEKQRQTALIVEKFLSSKAYESSAAIGLYMNTALEFDLSAVFKSCRAAGKKILIPKTWPSRRMSFIEYNESNLQQTNFGILEPVLGLDERPDLLVVPGLAWNLDSFRIGFGAGYYDRYLVNFKGDTVSLVYDFQRVDFEPEEHDRAVKELFSV